METLGVGSRVNHPAFGMGVVIYLDVAAYKVCFVQHGIKHVGKNFDKWEVIEAVSQEDPVSFDQAEKSLIKILRTWADVTELVDLGDKWKGGKLILEPEDSTMKSKEMPIEIFFHKIVMMRDRLRVMEQRINSSSLEEEEKINLEQYITRIYGSLTSFNVLFKNREHHFKGEKGV
jgi:hypothetical protein